MNILVLDLDPKIAAYYHCNKHVISQMKEGVQMLCTNLIKYDNKVPLNSSGEPYKSAHENHPCTKWVGKGLLNYQWLWDLVYALVEEAEYRFGNTYHIAQIMRDGSLPRTPDSYPMPPTRTPFANATADWLKEPELWDDKAALHQLSIVDKYRLYYILEKFYMTSVDITDQNIHYKYEHKLGNTFWSADAIWTNRGEPEFMGQRFYHQQCEYFGIKPGDLIEMSLNPDCEKSEKLRKKMERKMSGKKTSGVTTTKSKRRTKADILVEIRTALAVDGLDDVLKLKMDELESLLVSVSSGNTTHVAVPITRTKKPYVDCVNEALGSDIDLSKMTIKGLKELATILQLKSQK